LNAETISYFFRSPRTYSSAHFGKGHGDILIDDLECTGIEDDINKCRFPGWDNSNIIIRNNKDVNILIIID
jgi:hypothetical protein